MNILVTGGAGFIGKYLIKSLIEKNYSVTIFDNFSNSTKNSVSKLENLGVNIIHGDIRNHKEISNATKDKNIVIHLAAKISVIESIKNPLETFSVNLEGTKNVLEACEKNNVQKLIVASSAAVYGESKHNVKLTEESETNPISPYGESKKKMEHAIKKFELNHKINCVILRFFNIYGIGQTKEYAGVITKFLEKIKENRSIEIFGNGMQTRDFIAVEDVVSSIHNSIVNGKSGVYNIASGEAVTIKELAEKMISMSQKNINIKYLDEQKGNIRNSLADISLAKKDLKFFPKHNLDQIKKLL